MRKAKALRVVLVFLVGISVLTLAQAQAQITTTDLNSGLTPTDVVNTLLGPGITVSNVTYTGNNTAAGTFGGGTGILGFESGITLSSGNIAGAVGPNDNEGLTTAFDTAGDPDLDALIPGFTTLDAAVLEFDFTPIGSAVTV
jgi:hypothetical protein